MKPSQSSFLTLPFRFMRFGPDVLLVNEAGQYLFISQEDFDRLINRTLSSEEEVFLNLKNKHIVTDTGLALPVYLLATKYRTKKSFLNEFTALHIFIVTLRCNQKCRYCQAGSEDVDRFEYDMSIETAKKCVEYVFRSPSPSVKIEFQGGEPLLNFKIVRYIVEYAEKLNRVHQKNLEFVICTNLFAIPIPALDFLEEHNVWVSTSLDGPGYLHNANRITRKGTPTFDVVKGNIKLIQDRLGNDRLSALMVTTRDNVYKLNEVVDEYVSLGLNSIFIRPVHPYGSALEEGPGYDVAVFINNYIKTLKYIINKNLAGLFFPEQYATIILTKIFTPFSTGFVDLQSPAGAGISCAVYGYNGDVFASDEARMLSKMGDNRFLLGNVFRNNYLDIFNGKVIREIAKSSCLENIPLCSECAFMMYCGADPVRNYSVQGSLFGRQPSSESHQINFMIIHHLMELIRQGDSAILSVFWSWITNRPTKESRPSGRG